MKVRFHRDAKEIGGNCIELNSGGKTLLPDLGVPLNLGDSLDGALPAIAGLADGNNENFPGVVLSHPHADHYGLLSKAAKTTRLD